MVGRFSIGDIVLYQNKIYKINSAYLLNDFLPEFPIVYGLIAYNAKPPAKKEGNELLVSEIQLKYVTKQKLTALKVLYGYPNS